MNWRRIDDRTYLEHSGRFAVAEYFAGGWFIVTESGGHVDSYSTAEEAMLACEALA